MVYKNISLVFTFSLSLCGGWCYFFGMLPEKDMRIHLVICMNVFGFSFVFLDLGMQVLDKKSEIQFFFCSIFVYP